MPTQRTKDAAERDRREGKAPSTQAGEFVHEEIEHVREGKHGARSTKQAIAIGLSKARRAGVKLPAPKHASARTRRSAESDLRKGRSRGARRTSARRSRASMNALRREGRSAASRPALARQARTAAARRRRAGSTSRARSRPRRSRSDATD